MQKGKKNVGKGKQTMVHSKLSEDMVIVHLMQEN